MKKVALSALVSSLVLTGCATSNLLDDKPASAQAMTNDRAVLMQDRVVAFGSPSQASGLSQSNIVIVGEKNSYVLTEGGHKLVNLLMRLDPKNIHVDNSLDFYSPNNDGKFSGLMQLSYVKLKDEVERQDLQFFLQNGAKECTNQSDSRMGAQRYCFDINIQGGVYPQVSNYDLVRSQFRPLSRPYSVTMYTSQSSATQQRNTAEKLVLLPFALAFDVVTLPVQILSAL